MRVTSGHRLQSSLRNWRDLIPPANQADHDSMQSRFLFSPVIRRRLFVLFLSFCSFIHGSLSHSISSSYLSLSNIFLKTLSYVEHVISCRECRLPIRFSVNMRGIWSISKRRLFKLVVACAWHTFDDWRTTQLRRSHKEKIDVDI